MADQLRKFAVRLVGTEKASGVRAARLAIHAPTRSVVLFDDQKRMVAVFPLEQLQSICDDEAVLKKS